MATSKYAQKQNGVALLIRAGLPGDIPQIMELERSCSTAAHWTERQYRLAVEGGDVERSVLVAEDDSRAIAGFLVALHVADAWELENIVVVIASRRNGLATQLMNALLNQVHRAKSEAVFLEVRESNAAACAFYTRFGFVESARRRAYYANPAEDAVLYRLGPG